MENVIHELGDNSDFVGEVRITICRHKDGHLYGGVYGLSAIQAKTGVDIAELKDHLLLQVRLIPNI